jgi:hypothetical protein
MGQSPLTLQYLNMSHSDVYTALLTKQQTNMRMETYNSAHAAGITHYQLFYILPKDFTQNKLLETGIVTGVS